MAPSVVFLLVALAMGVVFIWDVGRVATAMRARLEERSMMRAWYKRLPPWTFRAFGVWCVVFGIGQLIFFIATVHGSQQ
jgi:energy-coupling factor transporter transmembrane protein EcfT